MPSVKIQFIPAQFLENKEELEKYLQDWKKEYGSYRVISTGEGRKLVLQTKSN